MNLHQSSDELCPGFSLKMCLGGAKNFQSPLGTMPNGREGNWEKFPKKSKLPLSQKFTYFWCFKHEIMLSDRVISPNVVKIDVKILKLY